jgi:hypothetical protein
MESRRLGCWFSCPCKIYVLGVSASFVIEAFFDRSLIGKSTIKVRVVVSGKITDFGLIGQSWKDERTRKWFISRYYIDPYLFPYFFRIVDDPIRPLDLTPSYVPLDVGAIVIANLFCISPFRRYLILIIIFIIKHLVKFSTFTLSLNGNKYLLVQGIGLPLTEFKQHQLHKWLICGNNGIWGHLTAG